MKPTHRTKIGVVAALLACFSIYIYCVESDKTMNRPLVYLVPIEFIGPVFVLFDQKDGTEAISEPAGNVVQVPPDGIIKLRAKVDDLIADPSVLPRNVLWMSLSQKGVRSPMIFNLNTRLNNQGDYIDSFIDGQGKIHEYKSFDTGDNFYYFTSTQKNESMVFNHGGCKHQRFAPEQGKIEPPDCAKFLIISPKQFSTMPHWLWNEAGREYDSITHLKSDAAIRIESIKKHYNIKKKIGANFVLPTSEN